MTDLAPREAVIARVRPHVRALFWPSMLLIVVVSAYGYLGSRFTEPWQAITEIAVAGILIVVGWLFPLLRWLARHYTITTRRVVVRSGVLVRTRQELLHSRGYSITVRRGWVQSMFGSGDLLLNSGVDTRIVMKDVPSVSLVHETLHDLIEREGWTAQSGRVHG